MKYKALLISLLIFGTVFVSTTLSVMAQPRATDTGGPAAGTRNDTGGPAVGTGSKIVPLQNPLNNINSFTDLLYKFVDLAIFIGVIFAAGMFFWIGFKFVMARGNSSELEEARKWFFYAVIGTAILISSKVIVEVMKRTLTSAGVVKEGQFDQKF